jgi:methylmalonyl-CoA/ethylmalonyl-CoA epimerase
MSRVLELLTVNVAVPSLATTVPRYAALGIERQPPVEMLEPPAAITDVSFKVPGGGAISLIEPAGPASPVARFLERRGPGVYSVALRVDDLVAAMDEWRAAGLEWVLDEPHAFEDHEWLGCRIGRLLVNWITPRSNEGVMLEVFEFGETSTEGARRWTTAS